MAMDKIFDFDNQEEFVAKAVESRDNLERCGLKMGYSDNWKDDLVSSLRRLNMSNDGIGEVMHQLVTNVIKEFRHPTKQYNFDKDDGRGRLAVPKKTPLMSVKLLLAENDKRRNPRYKSVVLRSMKYDRFDPTVISRCCQKPKTNASIANHASSNTAQDFNNEHEAGIEEIAPSNKGVADLDLDGNGTADCQFLHHDDRFAYSSYVHWPHSQGSNCDPATDSLPTIERNPCIEENSTECSNLNDIVVQVSIHVGYPRPLEKEELRLGRLLKVVDRFLVLGSNTLKELKDSIDCPADYYVFDDVSQRFLTDQDLCKQDLQFLELHMFLVKELFGYKQFTLGDIFFQYRYPSSFFFIHDTFYIDLEPKGSQDITEMIRTWATERGLGGTKVADMNTTNDDVHPTGPYPLPFYELNTRRISCAGCKMATSEWVVWNHESTPVPVQYFCESCYNDLNFDVFGERTFNFKAAPLYDRHNRKTDFVEREHFDAVDNAVPDEEIASEAI
ncbi:unnamed protein product [Angiostrongylus costaricensis]|uniref:snRNA-activating protein complex subunit 3 n=1 Tax=Angiostrongylus costaricensis TaxID=334426 RepID=A0A0R3PX94_ANGCS|nr:unnamed protein product [Angiostrongylus costaricensis]